MLTARRLASPRLVSSRRDLRSRAPNKIIAAQLDELTAELNNAS